jgi:hypothetical protein
VNVTNIKTSSYRTSKGSFFAEIKFETSIKMKFVAFYSFASTFVAKNFFFLLLHNFLEGATTFGIVTLRSIYNNITN